MDKGLPFEQPFSPVIIIEDTKGQISPEEGFQCGKNAQRL